MANSDAYIEKAQINRRSIACDTPAPKLCSLANVIIVAQFRNLQSRIAKEYEKIVFGLAKNQEIDRRALAQKLTEMHFERTNGDLRRGHFRLHGQVLEIMPVNEEKIYRLSIDEKISLIEIVDPISRKILSETAELWLFPAKHYIAGEESRQKALAEIEKDLQTQLAVFQKENKLLEHERLSRRVKYDLS